MEQPEKAGLKERRQEKDGVVDLGVVPVTEASRGRESSGRYLGTESGK